MKIALGSGVTRGLGAGGKPEVGQAAAKESLPDIENVLAGSDMVFVTAGKSTVHDFGREHCTRFFMSGVSLLVCWKGMFIATRSTF